VSVMLVITNTTIITITITYGDRGMVGAVAAERVPIPKERRTLQHRTLSPRSRGLEPRRALRCARRRSFRGFVICPWSSAP
jgi:hypothetical protein